MKHVRLALLVLAAVFAAALLSAAPMAEATSPADEVLFQEARWLKAITDGDRATIAFILLPHYKHINDQGVLIDRAQELANTAPLPVTFTATEQTVDFAGLTMAVVHGVNTITQSGKVIKRDLFTDVFVWDHGWRALAAHETAI